MSTSRDTNRVIVAGTGFGCRVHVPALRDAGFEVVGLVGADAERTARRAASNQVPQSFTDLDEAIVATKAGVVTIATTPSTHGALALKAIAQGCHVICEKPFARDREEAAALLAAAQKAGIVNLVGHEFRWKPENALIAKAIADGLIGEPRFLSVIQYIPFLADPEAKMPKWWFDAESGGGWLGASGSHIVDQVRTWIGDIASVSAALPIVSDRKNVAEDSFVFRFAATNGVEGVVQQTASAWGPRADFARVAGTHGTLSIENGAVWLADRQGEREIKPSQDFELPLPPEISDDPRKQFSHLEVGPYTRLCEALREEISSKRYQGPVALPTFAEGKACMAILDAIRASAAEGGALKPVS